MFEFLKPRNGPVVDRLQGKEQISGNNIPLRTLRADGQMGAVISRWTLTDEQRKAIAAGADIFLELSTFNQPLQPIRMAVSDASGDKFAEWFQVCLLNQAVSIEK